MTAIMHCIITEIENSRIKNNIQNWRVNTKIDNIRDKWSGWVGGYKDEIDDFESRGNGPCLKELKLKVWNVCGELVYREYRPSRIDDHDCHCYTHKQAWFKEIKIKSSSSFIYECIQYINEVTGDLQMKSYQLGEIDNPKDLKRIIVFLMVKQKHSINELKNELLEIEEKIEAEIKEIIN